MKKLAFSLIAYLAIGFQAHAATSPLAQSLLEYEAITSAIGTNPNFENVIAPSEFIVNIDRLTRKIDVVGKIKYEIQTQQPRTGQGRHKRCYRTNKYIAILNVSPNPGIGPNVVTVVTIKPINRN